MNVRTGSGVWTMLPALLLASLCGCGRTMVKPGMETASTNLPRPSRVIVHDFAVSSADITENQSIIQRAVRGNDIEQGRLLAIGQEAANVMADELVGSCSRSRGGSTLPW